MGQGYNNVVEKRLQELETQLEEEGGEVFHRADEVRRKIIFLRSVVQAEMSAANDDDRLRLIASKVDALEEGFAKRVEPAAAIPVGEGSGGGGVDPCDRTTPCFEDGGGVVDKNAVGERRPQVDDAASSDVEWPLTRGRCDRICMVVIAAVTGIVAGFVFLGEEEVEFLVPT